MAQNGGVWKKFIDAVLVNAERPLSGNEIYQIGVEKGFDKLYLINSKSINREKTLNKSIHLLNKKSPATYIIVHSKENKPKTDRIYLAGNNNFSPEIVEEYGITSTENVTKISNDITSSPLSEVYLNDEDRNTLIDLLECKKNVILRGPPGVGKTFTAKRLARALLAKNGSNISNPESRIKMVQFNQNYSYEEFVRGYRPNENGNGFTLVDGPFFELCENARKDLDNAYFFIIDEINRGNLSKIFGDLLMLIEADKRTEDYAVQLTYTRDGERSFFVPPNVYLIGTMNTADRSLAMIDYALRRRFSFFTLVPAFDDKVGIKKEDWYVDLCNIFSQYTVIINKIENLNREITKDKSLGTGFCIGHSFFCPLPSMLTNEKTIKKDISIKDWLTRVIKYEIYPLLEEYWFAEMNKSDDENKVKLRINEMLELLGSKKI